jgi:hypothetical protein
MEDLVTSAQAILAGAALIAVSILIGETIKPAAAQRMINGPFQLMHHTNPQANAGVFRVDTATGEVSYCFVTSEGNLVCSHPVQ